MHTMHIVWGQISHFTHKSVWKSVSLVKLVHSRTTKSEAIKATEKDLDNVISWISFDTPTPQKLRIKWDPINLLETASCRSSQRSPRLQEWHETLKM